MTGFYVSKPGGSLREDLPIPEPGAGEARIRVLRAGVCNTDLEILEGYMGFEGVLGHEFVGIVEAINTEHQRSREEDLRERWIGKRVCGDINVGCASCGVCANSPFDLDGVGGCVKYSRNHCPNRTVLGILNKHGTMAEYLTLPLRNLHEVPDHVSDEVAVFAEPLAAACRIVEQNLVRYENNGGSGLPPDRVAILGDGKLGLMIAEVLGREHSFRLGGGSDDDDGRTTRPPRPVLFGKHAHKLGLVEGTSGVECRSVSECIDTGSFTGVARKHEHAYDVVVDATGSPAGLKLAAGMCRPMGTLVLKSTCAAGAEQFNAAPFVIDELRVVGSRCGPIDRALELLAITDGPSGSGESSSSSCNNSKNDAGDVDVDGDDTNNNERTKQIHPSVRPLHVEKYITKTFPLSEAPAAIKCAAERTTMKVQIVCSSR